MEQVDAVSCRGRPGRLASHALWGASAYELTIVGTLVAVALAAILPRRRGRRNHS